MVWGSWTRSKAEGVLWLQNFPATGQRYTQVHVCTYAFNKREALMMPCQCSRGTDVLFLLLFYSPPPAVPGHLDQRVQFPVAQGRADGVFSTEEDSSLSGRRWLATLPQHLFWGWAVAFYMVLTSLWWIKVLHTEKQIM